MSPPLKTHEYILRGWNSLLWQVGIASKSTLPSSPADDNSLGAIAELFKLLEQAPYLIVRWILNTPRPVYFERHSAYVATSVDYLSAAVGLHFVHCFVHADLKPIIAMSEYEIE
jgi:hypothetical protein